MNTLRLLFPLLLFVGSSACIAGQIEAPEQDAFNKLIVSAREREEPWALHPVSVSLLFIANRSQRGAVIEHQEQISLRSKPEAFVDAEVVVVRSGFMDDSILGDEYEFKLRKQPGNEWLIESVSYGWRCREGRGHSDLSTAPCL